MINTDQLKDSINIVDIIDGYIGLKKMGKNYGACCPFHGEKTPSFTVAEDKQFYYCFGCGVHGDVIGFIMEYTGCDFKEAVTSIDSNAFIDNISRRVSAPVRKLRLPLSQKGNADDAGEILANCECVNGVYFNGAYQVVPLTDLNGLMVSLAMIEGPGFDVRYLNKQFVYGSCLIFGNPGKTVILVFDYFKAIKLYQHAGFIGVCIVCIFDLNNLIHIVKGLNQKKIKYQLFCDDIEELHKADWININSVLWQTLGNIVNTDNKLNIILE